MNNRKNAIRVLLSVAISSLTIFGVIAYCGGSVHGGESASDILLLAFGGGLLDKQNTMTSIMLGILPTFVLSFFLAQYIQDDFASCCVYIFTRSQSRFWWIAKKMTSLLGWIVVFYLLNFGVTFALLAASGYSVHFATVVKLCAVMLIFDVLATFILILPLNLLAIKTGAVQAFLICIGTYLLILIMGIFSSPALSKWLPFSQGNYVWHQPLWFAKTPNGVSCVIKGFSLNFSILYLLLVTMIELGVGMLIIKKSDLMSVLEGEN